MTIFRNQSTTNGVYGAALLRGRRTDESGFTLVACSGAL
jgi:hypothetical protein